MRSWSLLAALVAILSISCASAYDQTYQQETNRLEDAQRAREAADSAAHAEVRKYAAVVYFDVGSAVIKEDGFRELDWFIQQVQSYPKAVIQVQGFADATGGDAVNQGLSTERAENVARYLTSKGVPKRQIAPLGFASEFPAGSNQTAKGRKSNRRVEVTVR